mgnify:CR=1 FL=1
MFLMKACKGYILETNGPVISEVTLYREHRSSDKLSNMEYEYQYEGVCV